MTAEWSSGLSYKSVQIVVLHQHQEVFSVLGLQAMNEKEEFKVDVAVDEVVDVLTPNVEEHRLPDAIRFAAELRCFRVPVPSRP